jgi:pRiA4b ORF-3-like protein
MANEWLHVRVELLGGAGVVCDPPPGRVFVVGPQDTFGHLAEAIDLAFARWDLSHAHMFVLDDGSMIASNTDDWAPEMTDESTVSLSDTLTQGNRFTYVFDLGDDWQHDCDVVEDGIDPIETYGDIPPSPVPIWGWGTIPDQYGRLTEDDGWEGAQ